jgi:hypothetical protein
MQSRNSTSFVPNVGCLHQMERRIVNLSVKESGVVVGQPINCEMQPFVLSVLYNIYGFYQVVLTNSSNPHGQVILINKLEM